MSETDARRVVQEERANASLLRLVGANPGLAVDGNRAEWYVGTNFVTFGSFLGQPVVFKYFDWRPRKVHEETALRAFAPTGLVPKLYAVESDSVLVMERLRGSTLEAVEQNLEHELLQPLYHQLGAAMARIVEAAPGGASGGRRDLSAKPGFDYEFYSDAALPVFFDTVIERSAKVLAEHDVPERDVLERSLAALADHRDAILAYPSFVQIDDFHTCNIMADGLELTGFIDLEMTRWGNEALVLAAALDMVIDGRPERWAWIRRGYEDGRGRAADRDLLSLARIAAPFSQWIRFMWYWTWDPASLEEGARGWPIRDIKAIAETIQGMEL